MSAGSRFVIEGFFFFFFFLPSLLLPQLSVLAKEKGSGDPATPISLETDEAASLFPPSPLLFHRPPPLP